MAIDDESICPSADEAEKLSSLNGSNESPSVVLGKRKRNDSQSESDSEDSDSEDRNDTDSELDSEDRNHTDSESDSEETIHETEVEHENAGPSWFYTGRYGKIIGPIPTYRLKAMNDKGLLWPDTTVFKKGQKPDDAILLRDMLSEKRDDEETTHDLLRTHETQEIENEGANWLYRDPYGGIRGPVPRNCLNRWCYGCFLSPATTVWRVGQRPKDAILLKDMLLRTSIDLGKRKRTDEGDETHSGKTNKTDEGDEMLLGKRTKTDEGDGAAASNIIPQPLHRVIQVALQLKGKMVNKNCPDYFQSAMKQCEKHIETWVKKLKELKKLPHDWKYNPDTASNLVPAKPDIRLLPNMARREVEPFQYCCSSIDPGQKFPKTMNVPLDKEEKKIWKRFKESDQDYAGHQYIYFSAVDECKKPRPVDDPIVILASKFAVTAFNEAIEMYVKKGEQNNIHDEFDIVDCKYLKMWRSNYYFYITIDAFEEGIRGIYDTKVRLNWKDGSKSLMLFVLTDRKPRDDNKTMELKKPRTLPGSWQDVSWRSGMRPRRKREGICTGYDYVRPDGHVGP